MRLSDHQLVAAAFEGALGESEFNTLQRRLADEPALLALYREHALLHHSLCEEYEGRESLGDIGPPANRMPRWLLPLLAITALAAIALAAWKLSHKSATGGLTAGSVLSKDGQASIDGRPMLDGSGFAPGSRLAIERGWVRLKLPRGTVAIVEAPAAIVYEADRRLLLENGRARFQLAPGVEDFTVLTANLAAHGSGPGFGVISRPGGADEVHSLSGEIGLRASTGKEGDTLAAGKAAAVDPSGFITHMPARENEFASLTPEIRVLLEDRFNSGTMETGRRPQTGASHWRLEKGSPTISDRYLEGSDFETYFWLPADGLSAARPILLLTVETVPGSATIPFHSPQFAGFSLYQEGYEVCFFGDSYGPEETWSLDVKRNLVPLVPAAKVSGPRTMTLRYDRRDGTVELHDGAEPGESPLVRSKLLPGLNFDQVRIAAGPGASLAIASLKVSAIEDSATH
jgi:hypothetical protein